MIRLDKYSIGFLGLLLFHFTILFFVIDNYSISYKEAIIYFDNTASFLHYLTHFSIWLLGHNDYGLRIPFVVLYLASSSLLYIITKDYFRNERDRLICVAIFMVLPGVNSAAILVNSSIVVVFFTLLYLYLYKVTKSYNYWFLILLVFIDNSFAVLFLALFFYSLQKKENILLVISLVLFGISMSIYGFEIGGKPKCYFIETFMMYVSIFSPLLFLYFFYALYRVGIKWEKDLFWYISMTALVLSLLFSLRQKVIIEDFAPFVVISIPLMVKLFIHSLRIRLKEFRGMHYLLLRVSIIILVLNFFLLIGNKYFYLVMENPQKHFARRHHIAKTLADNLKCLEINNITTSSKRLTKRLNFYGIKTGSDYYITTFKFKNPYKVIKIKFYDTTLATYYVLDRTKKSTSKLTTEFR